MAQENTKKAKIVFMGTPVFAADILRSLLDWDGCSVEAVYTQPDKQAGRGKKLRPSPVKDLALAQGLPVFQPETMRTPEAEAAAVAALRNFAPDFLMVAAYGMILPQAVLDVPKYAPVNVHTSLLPRYRGAAPVQRAIMNGDSETGVSIMRMEAGLDTGPVYAQEKVAIEHDDAGSLFIRLAAASGPLLRDVLSDIVSGHARETAQDDALADYAVKISKQEGNISFRHPAAEVDAVIRGLTPDPGAHAVFMLEGKEALPVILENVCSEECGEQLEAGTVWASRKKLLVFCSSGVLQVSRLRPSGKKSMDAASFLNGQRLELGAGRVIGRCQDVQESRSTQ